MQLFHVWVTLLAMAPVLSQVAAPAVQQEGETTESLVRQATFIFRGTVVKPDATTMPSVPASKSTAIVRVDEVIEVPGGSPNLAGKEITVILRQSVKSGDQAVFYTKAWLMGNSLAVKEIARRPAVQATKQIQEEVRATHQRMEDEALLAAMASAEAIVAGKVAAVKPAPIPHIGSEHDPDWYEAEIAIESVETGHLTGPAVTVTFPNSEDVMWKTAPKFREGQQGIWLLHRGQAQLPGLQGRYTALKPLDFHPPAERARIQRLLQRSR